MNITYRDQRETAEILRVSERTLERWRHEGSGPRFRKAGRKVLYTDADIAAYLEVNTFQSTAEVQAA